MRLKQITMVCIFENAPMHSQKSLPQKTIDYDEMIEHAENKENLHKLLRTNNELGKRQCKLYFDTHIFFHSS